MSIKCLVDERLDVIGNIIAANTQLNNPLSIEVGPIAKFSDLVSFQIIITDETSKLVNFENKKCMVVRITSNRSLVVSDSMIYRGASISAWKENIARLVNTLLARVSLK